MTRPPGTALPHAEFDGSLAFLREGYGYVSHRCARLGTDLFRTRILLRPVICMRGREAAGLFYGNGRFTRAGAMPRSVLLLLQDRGSVQALDGEAHRLRKALFMEMMTPAALRRAEALFEQEVQRALPRWQGQESLVLHDALLEVLTRTAAAWAGVPLAEDEVAARTEELATMIAGAGAVGPRNWRARLLRRRCERWAASLVRRTRKDADFAPETSPLAMIAAHRDADGTALSDEVAAVELINLLRPTVAVGRFMVFAALALHEHPRWREAFASGSEPDIEPFVQEVRRFYPFFPVVGGRVRQPFDWRGIDFRAGQWVLLDLYGTNHDPRLWPEPESFRPERFRDWPGDPDSLIPQGAGAFLENHRCPGEWLTIALVGQLVRLLCRTLRYDVPAQDLRVRLDRMPALPESGFVMRGVAAA